MDGKELLHREGNHGDAGDQQADGLLVIEAEPVQMADAGRKIQDFQEEF